jgi:hypothetical protein
MAVARFQYFTLLTGATVTLHATTLRLLAIIYSSSRPATLYSRENGFLQSTKIVA